MAIMNEKKALKAMLLMMKNIKKKPLNLKFGHYKKFWGGIENVRSEVYILKMGNTKT